MTQLVTSLALDGVEGLTKRDFRDIGKQSIGATGLRHRRRNLHHHFEKRAYARYGYARRRGDRNPLAPGTYSNRKLKLFGHVKPLTFAGELRRLTLAGVRLVRAIARSGGELVAKLRLPRKANLSNPKSAVKPLKELRAFAAEELQDLDNFLTVDFDRRYSRRTA